MISPSLTQDDDMEEERNRSMALERQIQSERSEMCKMNSEFQDVCDENKSLQEDLTRSRQRVNDMESVNHQLTEDKVRKRIRIRKLYSAK